VGASVVAESRVALFSDVYGNLIALDAVLADISARGGADAYWVVGDIPAASYLIGLLHGSSV
jgi:hypothetical protein